MIMRAVILSFVLLPLPAVAGNLDVIVPQDPVMAPAAVVPDSSPRLIFTLRGGVAIAPEYFGSDELTAGPDFGFRLNYANLGGREFGSTVPGYRKLGFGLGGSFRYIDERSAEESPELEGLEDIDAAVELGVKAGYTWQDYEVFADVRYGVTGHDAVVGELGADVLYRPSDRLTLSAGPRVFVGDNAYADTYFGVTSDEAAASDFDQFDAEGGMLSAGVEVGMSYDFSDRWGVEGAVRYDVLTGDASESPIVEQGSDDQVSLRLGLTRRISFGF